MKANLKEGILCIEADGVIVILDTGSPVSLGTGDIINLGGIPHQTQDSSLGYDWQSLKDTLPFSVSALIGTDQMSGKSISINLKEERAAWTQSLNNGLPMEMVAGVPVVSATLNGKKGRFFFDTGASICYVTDEKDLLGCNLAGNFNDFHPMLGKFSTQLFSSSLNINEYSA